MIGQTKLKKQVGDILQSGKFPRFSIFIGERGSGRRTFIKEMLLGLGDYQECDSDVDTVRQVVAQSYMQMASTVYVFSNADDMSVGAKNALLKVTEESPNNAYFVMTLTNAENTLQTIRSRASVFYMDAYTPNEILEYYHTKTTASDDEIIKSYCNVPGDVDLLCSYDLKEFQKFVQMVIGNVEKVSGANSFKIGNKLNLGVKKNQDTQSSDGYDLMLFWKAFRAECLDRLGDDPLKYVSGINVTSTHMRDSRISGINRQMSFDTWLLDLRKAWM